MSCNGGGLHVYDNPDDDDDSLLGVFCGHRFPWSIHASGSNVYMKLIGVEWRRDDVINLQFDVIGNEFISHIFIYHEISFGKINLQ